MKIKNELYPYFMFLFAGLAMGFFMGVLVGSDFVKVDVALLYSFPFLILEYYCWFKHTKNATTN